MFDRITTSKNFIRSFNSTRLGKCKYKAEALKFYTDWPLNLERLRQELINDQYQVSDYTEFKVYEPKVRVIRAPKYRDKIIHHAVNNVLREYYEPKFIVHSYACIRGRGTHSAIRTLRLQASRASKIMEDPHFIKMDISKFFYTIDHEILKTILRKKTTCERTLALLYRIIDSAGDVGLPLGNLTSQILANIYMNELDQYAKHTLKLRYYVRYADDFFVVVDGREEAKRIKNLLGNFVTQELNMRIAEHKCGITKVSRGVVALGMKVYPTHVLLLGKHKRTARKIVKKGNPASINSWKSFASSADCYNFMKLVGMNPIDKFAEEPLTTGEPHD